MGIATYNVNSVNARLPVLLRWLAETQPGVACLQELKAPQEKFPLDAIREAGYQAIWHGQKAWNGVAILARSGGPVESGRGLAGDPDDAQSRYLEGTVGAVRVGRLYLPNGDPAPGPKFDSKLRWLERFAARAAELVGLPDPVVLAGDYNVLPEELDVYDPRGWEADALLRAETREAYRRRLAQGVDGCPPAPEPGQAGLHPLGLHERGVAAERGAADRPPAPRPGGLPAPRRGRRRPGRARVGKASDHALTLVELRDR